MIAAGALRVPFSRVTLGVSAANLALSAWYGVGAAVDEAGVVLVFLGALALPAAARRPC